MFDQLRGKTKATLGVLGILFLASPLLVSALKPNNYSGGRSRNEFAKAQRNSSAVANIVGEFRASVSDIMFIKTERYLHGGVAYDAHMNLQSLSAEKEIEDFEHNEEETESGHEGHEHDEHCDHSSHSSGETEVALAEDTGPLSFDDEGSSTLIPAEENDFRGFIGHLERNIRPWVDPSKPHVHSSGTELLPWYRVMTISDPNNVRAYVLGAWWLFREGKEEEGYAFIDEGMENNPDAFQLPYYKGRWQMTRMRIAEKELRDSFMESFRDQAIENYIIASEIVFRTRPKIVDARKIDYINWSIYDEEDAGGAVRFAVLLMRNHGREAEALELARRGAPVFHYIDEEGIESLEDFKLGQYRDELAAEIGVPFPLRPDSN